MDVASGRAEACSMMRFGRLSMALSGKFVRNIGMQVSFRKTDERPVRQRGGRVGELGGDSSRVIDEPEADSVAGDFDAPGTAGASQVHHGRCARGSGRRLAVGELMHASKLVGSGYYRFTAAVTLAGLFFLVMSLIAAALVRMVETRVKRSILR